MKRDQRLHVYNLAALPPGTALHQHNKQCGMAVAITHHPYSAELVSRHGELKSASGNFLQITPNGVLTVPGADHG